MTRRRTKCLPLYADGPAPPPSQWVSFCARIVEDEESTWVERPLGPRPDGICPRCWPRAVAMFQHGVTIERLYPPSQGATMLPTYQTANKAIEASRAKGETVEVAVTPENWETLLEAASDRWFEDGRFFFACAERGDDWIVVIARRP